MKRQSNHCDGCYSL